MLDQARKPVECVNASNAIAARVAIKGRKRNWQRPAYDSGAIRMQRPKGLPRESQVVRQFGLVFQGRQHLAFVGKALQPF